MRIKKVCVYFLLLFLFLPACNANMQEVITPVSTTNMNPDSRIGVPGYMVPDYAISLITENLEVYGDFSDIDEDIIADCMESFSDFADLVIGKTSQSAGVEIFVVRAKTGVELHKDVHAETVMNSFAKKRADAAKKEYLICRTLFYAAIVFADTKEDASKIADICGSVFTGQLGR